MPTLTRSTCVCVCAPTCYSDIRDVLALQRDYPARGIMRAYLRAGKPALHGGGDGYGPGDLPALHACVGASSGVYGGFSLPRFNHSLLLLRFLFHTIAIRAYSEARRGSTPTGLRCFNRVAVGVTSGRGLDRQK